MRSDETEWASGRNGRIICVCGLVSPIRNILLLAAWLALLEPPKGVINNIITTQTASLALEFKEGIHRIFSCIKSP